MSKKKIEKINDTYFNVPLFTSIVNRVNTELYYAIDELKKYVERYPLDYSAQVSLSGALIKAGEFEEAEKMLNYIEECLNNGKIKHGIDKVTCYYALNKMRLYSYTGRYREFNWTYHEYFDFFKKEKKELNVAATYNYKQLGILKIDESKNNGYTINQIVNYSYDAFLKHLEKHFPNNDPYCEEIFRYNFPVKEALDFVKGNLNKDKIIYSGFYDDKYIFKFNECGRVKGKITDFFRVNTFHGTKDIISMSPIDYGEKLPYTDANIIRKDLIAEKILKMKRSDMFNKKYGLK